MKSFLIAMAVALSFAAPAVALGQDKAAEVKKPGQPAKKQQKKRGDGKTKRKSATIAPGKDAKKAAQHKKPLEQPPSAASAQAKGVIVQPEGSGDGSGPRKAPLRFNPKPEK
jgi:Ni/Co efflux regulator RcnB